MVVHSSWQSDWGGVVGEGPDHMQVAGHRAQEVQSQVTEGNNGIPQQTESLPCQDESALVLLPLLLEKKNKQALTHWPKEKNETYS